MICGMIGFLHGLHRANHIAALFDDGQRTAEAAAQQKNRAQRTRLASLPRQNIRNPVTLLRLFIELINTENWSNIQPHPKRISTKNCWKENAEESTVTRGRLYASRIY